MDRILFFDKIRESTNHNNLYQLYDQFEIFREKQMCKSEIKHCGHIENNPYCAFLSTRHNFEKVTN